MNTYNKYFQTQYKLSYDFKHVDLYRKWFYSQWIILKEFLPKENKLSVLEVGSGIGTLYSYLISEFKDLNYTGLELDNRAVKFCNNFYKTDCFTKISIESMKNNKNNYNCIFAFEVLEHLEEPYKVISKIHLMLKQKGVFIGTSPYPYHKNIYADKTHRYVLTPDNWEKLFKDAGFRDVQTIPMSFFPLLWRIHKYINIRLPFFIPIPGFISTTLIVAYKM